MNEETPIQRFVEELKKSIAANSFIKLSLSKPALKQNELRNVYVRLIHLKDKMQLSFTYRFRTKDEVKNFSIEESVGLIEQYLGKDFLHGHLFTLEKDFVLLYNKKRKANLLEHPATQHELKSTNHNREKKRNISAVDSNYLYQLGISDKAGKVLKKGQKKFKQINKYIELIQHTIEGNVLPKDARIVDMGSGKGYLTFALYDYLKNNCSFTPQITGIELRENLVEFCQNLSQELQFEGLQFLASDIHDFNPERIDMLIALHACDIATDIAIAKGIRAGAKLIMVAPCCHKQIRKQLSSKDEFQAILRHGILAERQAELITDGLRALIMEQHGYKTKVFEFISSEHTSKNLMIVGKKEKINPKAKEKIEGIKKQFGIAYHYLETIL